MATTEELLAQLENNPEMYAEESQELVIDAETRTINIPASETLFGVKGDKNIERKYFRCPRIVGDNVDLSTHLIYIAYVYTESNSGSIFPSIGIQPYHCDDVEVDGDDITFSWKLSDHVFQSAGFIAFKMYAKEKEDSPYTVFNTAPAIGTVLYTIGDGEDSVVSEHPDIINQLIAEMEGVREVATPEAMQRYVNNYMKENPVSSEDIKREMKNLLTLGINEVDGLAYIFIDGQPVGDGLDLSSNNAPVPVYGNPVSDTAMFKLTSRQTAVLGVKLSRKPTQEQTITLFADTELITFSETTLHYTTADWNEMQYVMVTIGDFEQDMTATIIMRNSDELQTDTTIPVYLVADMYSVDTTIPDGAHVLTEEDVDDMLVHSNYGAILKSYIGSYTNVIVPASITYNDVVYSPVAVSPNTFAGNDVVQYITLEEGAMLSSSSTNITSSIGGTNKNFAGASALIGIKIPGYESLNMNSLFEYCTNLKFVDGLEKTKKITGMQYAFRGCTSLEYIQDLSEVDTDRNEKNNYTDGNYAFRDCTALKKVYGLPPLTNATGIFYGCTNLEEAIIPETVGTYEFEYNGGYENSRYARYAFYGCINLKKITVLTEVATPDLPASLNDNCVIYAIEGSDVYNNLQTQISSLPTATLLPYGAETESQVIAIWGDSTSSLNTKWVDWPTRLGNDLDGFTIKNQAVSGEYTTSTSARQGGNALKIGAFTIPSDLTPVPVTLKSEDGHTFGTNPVFSAGGSFNPCKIAGVRGTISNNSGNYMFTRLDNGEMIEVSDNTIVTSIADTALNSADVMLINLGINSGWDENADVLLNQVQMMVDHFTDNGGTKYIICGPCSGKYLRTEELRQVVFSYEEKAAAAFGAHWLNLREYLIQNGLAENDLIASELDTERMAVGQIPASLLGGGSTSDIKIYDGVSVTDDTHQNVYGVGSIKNAFYSKGKTLGYWE